MKRTFAVLLVFNAAFAADKRPPQGQAENDVVAATATILSQEQVKQEFGSNFGGSFTVLEVRLAPKGGKALPVRLDDFVLRSESDGDHSGPLVAAQIVDGGALVVQHTFAPRTSAESAPMIASTKVEMKDDPGKGDSAKPAVLEALKKRILAEKTTSEPESGLLFFPLEREKPKNLALSYATPGGKLRIEFK